MSLDNWDDLSFSDIELTDDSNLKFFEPTVAGPRSSQRVGASSFEVWGQPHLTVGPNDLRAPYTSIQTALNALQESRHSGIFILDGEYQLTDPLYYPDRNIDLKGESQNAIIKNAAGEDLFILNDLSKTYTFSNFAIESQNTSSYSKIFNIYGSSNTSKTSIDNVKIDLADNSGVNLRYGDTGIYSDGSSTSFIEMLNSTVNGGLIGASVVDGDTKIDNTTFDAPRDMGIRLASTITGDVINCSNNRLINLNYRGIECDTNSLSSFISKNFVSFLSGSAIATQIYGIAILNDNTHVSGNTVNVNNTVDNTVVEAIYTNGSKTQITDNIVNITLDSTGNTYGIYGWGSQRSNLSGNNITIDNIDTTGSHYGMYALGASAGAGFNYNNVNNNVINGVNNNAADIGIYTFLTLSYYNTGIGNYTQNVGVSISQGPTDSITGTDR